MLRQSLTTSSRALLAATRQTSSRTQVFRAPIAASLLRQQQQIQQTRQQPTQSRWYSDQASETKKDDQKPNGNSDTATEESVEATLRKQLEAKDTEIRDWKVCLPPFSPIFSEVNNGQDKYLRSVADFRNLQDRTTRDMKAARDFAIQKFAKDLVDSVDNFDRALAMVPESRLSEAQKSEHLQELVNLHDGLRMTEKILMQTLKNHGLERFDPAGEVFNPNEHEATFMTPMPEKEHNTVIHTQQKGFKLNGRVLRPAKVGVAKNR